MQMLSLTGGGFRGLYTAEVISRLENHFNTKMHTQCDCIAGTSIGGILAIGLAAGKSGEQLSTAFKQYGPIIFKKKSWYHSYLYSARYSASTLKQAIIGILGEDIAHLTLSQLFEVNNTHIILSTVEMDSGQTLLINSIEQSTKDWSVLDAALATSAAPTYFESHEYRRIRYIDGGVTCNMPDLAATSLYSRLRDKPISDIQLLSIGTGKIDNMSYAHIASDAGGISWAKNVSYFLDVQTPIIERQCEVLFYKNKYARINENLDIPLSLDDISEDAIAELIRKAHQSTSPEAILSKPSLIKFMQSYAKQVGAW